MLEDIAILFVAAGAFYSLRRLNSDPVVKRFARRIGWPTFAVGEYVVMIVVFSFLHWGAYALSPQYFVIDTSLVRVQTEARRLKLTNVMLLEKSLMEAKRETEHSLSLTPTH